MGLRRVVGKENVSKGVKRVTGVGKVGLKVGRAGASLAAGSAVKGAGKMYALSKKVHSEIRKNIVTAITAAFGFMVALVWRDAIKESIDKILIGVGLTGETYLFTIISAVLITFIAVIGIMFVSRWAEKKETEKK